MWSRQDRGGGVGVAQRSAIVGGVETSTLAHLLAIEPRGEAVLSAGRRAETLGQIEYTKPRMAGGLARKMLHGTRAPRQKTQRPERHSAAITPAHDWWP